MKHKIISGLLFLLFASFAALQYNDPDPWLWIIIYGIVAISCLLRVFNAGQRRINLIIIGILGVFSLVYIPGFYEWLTTPDKGEIFGEMVYEKPYIEETREFIGLMMAIAGMVYQYKVTKD